MKRIIYIIAILTFLISCKSEKRYDEEKSITITGKLLNYDGKKRTVDLVIYRVCKEKEILSTELSDLGEFRFDFKSSIPIGTEIKYKKPSKVLVYPNDSIHIELDGNRRDFVNFLKSTEFSGDSEKLNNDVTAFLSMYYSDYPREKKTPSQEAIQKFTPKSFEFYLDTIELEYEKLYEKFEGEIAPCEAAKEWVRFFVRGSIYNMLLQYVFMHPFDESVKPGQWQIPVSFYNRITKSTPISYNTFLNSQELHYYLDKYLIWYVGQNTVAEEAYKQGVAEKGYVGGAKLTDSIRFEGIIKYTPDKLLQQLIFVEKARRNFDRLRIDFYENNKAVFDEIITEPFLKQTISEKYRFTKEKLENPKIPSEAILKSVKNTPAKEIMDSILIGNKGRVIYIDCWADFCGPCLAELPNSKKLMDELKGQDVEFVFICMNSDKKIWKAILEEYQLGGQHYFFSKVQSEDWTKTFNISSIPYYYLIDKDGTIIENGSYLKPNVANKKIRKLLNE